MQLGFIGFGVLLAVGVFRGLLHMVDMTLYKKLMILVYAVSVAMSGWFCTKPFTECNTYSKKESGIHSFFAQLAGFSFSLGVMLYAVQEHDPLKKGLHIFFLVFVLTCSILFGKIGRYRGYFQRIMYLGSFVWLVLFSR